MIGCALAVASAVGLSACGSTPKAAPSGASLVAQASTAAASAGSVRIKIVATQTTGGKQQPAETLTSKISAPASVQSIRFPAGTAGNLDVMLIGSTAYVRADAPTLFKGLGLTTQGAQRYAGQWISIQQGDSPFSGIADTLTLDAQMRTFLPVGPSVTVGSERTLRGQRVLPLTGPASANHAKGAGISRLFINPKTKLPVAGGVVKASTTTRNEVVAQFTQWGKPVELTPPADAVPYSTATKA